jgi:hypothetical protein
MNAKRLAKQGRKEQQKEGQKAKTRSCVSHHGRTVKVSEFLSSRTLEGSCRPICTAIYRKSWADLRVTWPTTPPSTFKIPIPPPTINHTHIMPSKPKTSRQQHSRESLTVILQLHSLGYSSLKIHTETNVLKSIITRIIKQADLHLNILI